MERRTKHSIELLISWSISPHSKIRDNGPRCSIHSTKCFCYAFSACSPGGESWVEIELFLTEQAARGFADTVVSRHETVEKSHGRIETRIITATDDIAWLKERHDWPGLNSIVMVETVREVGVHPNAKIERETRFYIASAAANAEALGAAIRGHWSIENALHWVMDMVFRGLVRRFLQKIATFRRTCTDIQGGSEGENGRNSGFFPFPPHVPLIYSPTPDGKRHFSFSTN